MKYRCICEVCGREEILTREEMYNSGWDYPPGMYAFAIVSPRTCPNCPIDKTVWWKIVVEKKDHGDQLTDEQMAVVNRIMAEPASIEVEDD